MLIVGLAAACSNKIAILLQEAVCSLNAFEFITG